MSQTKILIVDDDSHIRTLGEAIFNTAGYEVILAVDGQDGINQAIMHRPDIILTDVNMPNKNGFELCKQVRKHPDISETPLIMVSAMGDDYNKLTGFDEGADDYVTKPFNIEELKARVRSLLSRSRRKSIPVKGGSTVASEPIDGDMAFIKTGIPSLDECLSGGLPKGSNILVLGPIGSGKSSFARQFMINGLHQGEPSLLVALDDSPKLIRKQLQILLPHDPELYERENQLRLVDAYSWSTMLPTQDGERFSLTGTLDLNQLSGAISDAGSELGQSVQKKRGGRRVIDSISSLLVHFELPAVQRFISQIARTSLAFGDVTTLFVLEQGTASEQVLNNIKYLMDGVIEFDQREGRRYARVASMKWIKSSPDSVAI